MVCDCQLFIKENDDDDNDDDVDVVVVVVVVDLDGVFLIFCTVLST